MGRKSHFYIRFIKKKIKKSSDEKPFSQKSLCKRILIVDSKGKFGPHWKKGVFEFLRRTIK